MNSDSHIIPLEELKSRFKTDLEEGLTIKQVQENIQLFGQNQDEQDEASSYLTLFFKHQLNLQSFVLWGSALLSFYNYMCLSDEITNLYSGLVIMIAIFITSAISVNVERNNENTQAIIKNRYQPQYTVVRDNVRVEVFSREIAVGDILFIEQGQNIPVDGRLLRADQMRVDHSALTGESEPIQRLADESNQNIIESKNVVLKGTKCVRGFGKCVVIAVGSRTILGQICSLSVEYEPEDQEQQIKKIAQLLVLIGLILGSLLMLHLFIFSSFSLSQTLNAIVGLLVAFIPFTLPTKYKVLQDQSLLSLLQQNILVKQKETLVKAQKATCILADKTGTITMNQQVISHLFYGQNLFKTAENHFDEAENFNPDDQDFQNLYKSASLSCNASFVLEGDQNNVDYSTCKMLGGLSDQVLLRFLHGVKNVDNFKKNIQYAKHIEGKAAKLEFNSINKFQFSIVEEEAEDSHYAVYFEGGAEKIISLCQFYMKNNSKLEIDSSFKENVLNCLKQLDKKNERALGFAKLHLLASQFPKGYVFEFDTTDLPFSAEQLTFQGLFSLKDQIKPEAKSVVEFAKQIGIRTIMQTGDSQLTAQYTARAINILPSNIESTSDLIEKDPNLSIEDAINKTESILIGGDQVLKLKEKLYINKQNLVFYRATPEQKFQIVKNLQSNNEVVLAVGDGTNDAPALKRSDISLSMYKKGTQIAHEASNAIVLDDRFDSVMHMILESRYFMLNLKKTIIKSLSLVFVEFACIFAFAIFQIPLPLSSFSILLIQILTDVIPTFISLNPKPSGSNLKKIYQKVEPVCKETFISSLFSVKVIASLIVGFVSYIYTFQSFGFSSVFGLANIKGYQPPAFQNKQITGQEVFYNENLEKISRNCFENQMQTEQIKFEIDWLSQKQRHYDLRQVLLQCDPQTKKWVPSVKWGTCNTNLSSCYSTQAYYWAQISFFSSVILVFISFNLIF
ncbi:E1-E2 ATPase family protein (macronuclear) [Tetrahymena thermophila SB210]|uniref:E1-E2 ATPase family protein n=1 Tax=Tetrahymena thermophila (strain SB210) TaxID=312017 RepID=Q23CL4_TETTS|nr:E1-E2 ATPase family protein [Tetrahymena thermophila SB210]EAR94266.1 E1-E2 ATPase family protein [Tetrahymena thermophila SB210]|eukprot:XP_001014511.1 E1-E2 ATPase family protein [Tetrahymena thermophila SB210]